jgi:hypothetical protein
MTQTVIDLSGPQGNAFYLLGVARQLSKELNLDGKAIEHDMMSSNYEHLLEVFEKHFGDYVILDRDDYEDG